jgi:hypothetical protein
MFIPGQRRDKHAVDGYSSWPRLDEIFSEFISGVQTKNDRLFVDFDREALATRMEQHLAQRGELFQPELLRPYVVGPFDRRWIYYDPRLLGRARWQVMRHMVQAEPNIALVFMRQSTSSAYDHALVVDALASDRVFYSRRGAPFVAPLWQISDLSQDCSPNLKRGWVDGMREQIGSTMDLQSCFAYVYAILHSPRYRSDHLAQLQRGFPRIPWPESSSDFARITAIGRQLIACHLGKVISGQALPLEGVGASQYSVARGYPRLEDDTLWLNRDYSLRLPDAACARFHLGGHPVLRRWLQVRRGRALSAADLQHVATLCDIAVTTHKLACAIDAITVERGS